MLLLFVSVTGFAQKEVTKFLGIPVDGYKSEMIQKLKAKGYNYNNTTEYLEGEFNGRDVRIAVVTNNNKVYRVFVVDEYSVDESQIKIRFRGLLIILDFLGLGLSESRSPVRAALSTRCKDMRFYPM